MSLCEITKMTVAYTSLNFEALLEKPVPLVEIAGVASLENAKWDGRGGGRGPLVGDKDSGITALDARTGLQQCASL